MVLATSVLFQFPRHKNPYPYVVKSFIPRNKINLSTHLYYLRIYPIRALLQTPCRFFGDHTFYFWASIWAAD